jgi:hypothetical protein
MAENLIEQDEVEELLNYREFMAGMLKEAKSDKDIEYFRRQIMYCDARLAALNQKPGPACTECGLPRPEQDANGACSVCKWGCDEPDSNC